MKKSWTKFGLLLVLAFTLILSACGSDEGNNEEASNSDDGKVLKAVTNAAYPPMEYLDGKEVAGFDADLIKALGEEIGYTVELSHIGWDAMFAEVDSGNSDLAIAAITITDERKESYDFSHPYYESVQNILAPEDSNINSIEDLEGKKVAVQNGTTGHELAKEIFGENSDSIVLAEDITIAVQQLQSGGADAVIADRPVTDEYLKNNEVENLKVIDVENVEPEYFGIMFPKGSELKAEFDEALNALYDNGKFAEIYEKWFGTEPNIEELKALQ